MDWLKAHINEIVLPNIQGELQEQTGITLDETLGEFQVVAEPLDGEDENCEEFEITIKLGELLLVDACFLIEEVEGGFLPLCSSEEELTRELIDNKLRAIKEKVIPLIREEFVQELVENDWHPKLAHLLDISPEILEDAGGLRSSGGYPPMVLVFHHPEYDPDAFEIQTRIDPMATEEWIDWKKLMEEVNSALKAIGEEPHKTERAPEEDSAGPSEPSAADLADAEIAEIESGLAAEAPPAKGSKGKGKGKADLDAALSTSLLASLEQTLGIALTADSKKKKAKGKAKKAKAPAKKKAPPEKKAAKKKAKKAPPGKKAAKKKAKKAPPKKKAAKKKAKKAPPKKKAAKKKAKKAPPKKRKAAKKKPSPKKKGSRSGKKKAPARRRR